MRDRFLNFMSGRHGLDALGRFTLIAAVVVMILNMFVNSSILSLVEWALLILTVFRMFSRNHSKREAENESYMQASEKVKNWFNGRKRIGDKNKGQNTQNSQAAGNSQTTAQEDPTVCIFVCPNCGQKVRVPKGKGKIEITCPKCGSSFVERS